MAPRRRPARPVGWFIGLPTIITAGVFAVAADNTLAAGIVGALVGFFIGIANAFQFAAEPRTSWNGRCAAGSEGGDPFAFDAWRWGMEFASPWFVVAVSFGGCAKSAGMYP